MVLDAHERLASLQVGLRAPINFAYDARGRLASAAQGSRVTTFSYGVDGYMSRATDPMGRTTRFAYDAGVRLASMTLPDGRVVAYTYDANGNRTSVKPPGRLAHRFTYTAVDELGVVRSAGLRGTGVTTYTYDVDRRLTAVTRPGGQTIRDGYDAAGRLASIAAPTGTTTFAYEAGTGRLARAVNSAEFWPTPTLARCRGAGPGRASCRGASLGLIFGLLGRLGIGQWRKQRRLYL